MQMLKNRCLLIVLWVGIGMPSLPACSTNWNDADAIVTNDVQSDNTKSEAVQYLADLQIIGPWHGDDAYERELLKNIGSNEPRVDPETGFLWGSHTQPKGYHSQFEYGTKVRPTREAMNYAATLIASPQVEYQTQGCKLLEKVIALQDQNPKNPTFGIWSWYYEESLSEMASPDYNWADFLGATLATLLHDYPDRLPPELLAKSQKSLERCALAIIKRDVKPNYTNIAMMGAAVTAAAGELLDRKDFLDYGRMRIRRNLEHYRETGNFNEYNSPNYTPVVIRELERMLYLVKDETCRVTAAELLIGAWQTVAEHYHVPTGQWAGPFSRTYSDTISQRTRDSILAQALVLSDDASGDVDAASFSPFVPRLACPESLRHYFTEIPKSEIERQHVFNKANRDRLEIGTTWLTPVATLGSTSYHTFWEQARGLIGYWVVPESDEPAVLKLMFLHNGKDFSSACTRNRQVGGKVLSAIGVLRNQGSMHPTFDRPKDGEFFAESFEVVYQLTAKGAQCRELSSGVFELSAGPIRCALHVAENCVFNGQPMQWQLEEVEDTLEQSNGIRIVKLVGVCHRGESKAFSFHLLGETRIGVGLELLQKKQLPSQSRVLLQQSKLSADREGVWYEVVWESVDSSVDQESKLTAPALPTNR